MGGQKGIVDFYTCLSKEAEVTVVASKENSLNDIFFDRKYNFLFNHWKGILNLFYLGRLMSITKKHQIDVILIEHSYFGWIGLFLRYFTDKPFVIHSHNIETHRFKLTRKKGWKLYGYYEKWVHRKSDFSFFKCSEDAAWAVQHWKLKEDKLSVVTYGTAIQVPPSQDDKMKARNELALQYSIQPEETLFLFNGTLDYAPNVHVLKIICRQIIPSLQKENIQFRIIICGNRLSKEKERKLQSCPQIIYAGFVPDINIYLRGADAFINPAEAATGIKTKLVEALANNLAVISTISGARGIPPSITNKKLILVPDNDSNAFIVAMKQVATIPSNEVPAIFFQHFYWGNIIQQALLSLRRL